MSNKRVKQIELEELIKDCFKKSLSINGLEKFKFDFNINSIYARVEYKDLVTKEGKEKVINKFKELLNPYTGESLIVVEEPILVKTDNPYPKIKLIIQINYDIIE